MESRTNNMYEVCDDEIIYMISENNEDAKEALFRKYSPMIHKEINKVKKSAYALGVEYNDLVQEAMLGFSNAINSYNQDEEAQFGTYATLCVRRKLINVIDKSSTQKHFNIKNAVSLDEEVDDSGHSYESFLKDLEGNEPLNKVITEESLSEVNDKVSGNLTKIEKEALDYSIDGLSSQEIAVKMGLNVKQVYNLIHRARKKIQID